ncbi:hypothetical protein VNO78_07991 [Psophocarpus tetragonolobus]|uniref:Uncharacterized protein n=1 Tax=Psophocarpus tetragonolobus TaxID=3891 RepID=A0AAN9SVM0_PSOTE
MKLSLKFLDENEKQQHSTQMMTAKVPITIFNKPFLSGVTATTATHSPSDFSFSLSTNFSSGPSLKASYSPTASLPFSLSLKSGLGLLGSPAHSPLVFSATFSLSPSPTPSHSPVPSFFLHFKPQFGHFSLHKTVFSHSNPQPPSLPPPPELLTHSSSTDWQNLNLEPCATTHNTLLENHALSTGVRVMARTLMPVTKGFFFNFRWAVHFPPNLGSKMPTLTVNKICLQRVEEAKHNNNAKQRRDVSETDLQLLKGRDLESVEKENRDMKRVFDEVQMGISTARNHPEESYGGGRKMGENSGEFQQWRSYKSGRQEDEKKVQQNKPQSVAADVESELQKAIKAATS